MPSELLSTARPSRTRLFGFLAIIVGAALIGIGATRQWASIGFLGDTRHAADVPVNGTDLWEGKAVLLAAAVALVLMLVMRIATSATTRRVMAVIVVVLGVAATSIGVWFALTAENRYAQTEGIDRIAAAVARQTGDAEDVVRAALEKTLRGDLRVDVGFSVWLVVIGGIALAVGGVLSLLWVRERERLAAGPDPDVPPAVAAEPGPTA
jgi:tryptophan-associated transmembrane protein